MMFMVTMSIGARSLSATGLDRSAARSAAGSNPRRIRAASPTRCTSRSNKQRLPWFSLGDALIVDQKAAVGALDVLLDVVAVFREPHVFPPVRPRRIDQQMAVADRRVNRWPGFDHGHRRRLLDHRRPSIRCPAASCSRRRSAPRAAVRKAHGAPRRRDRRARRPARSGAAPASASARPRSRGSSRSR